MRTTNAVFAAIVTLLSFSHANGRELRVCADPNNLPFSNEQQQGFENKIVAILARDLHAEVQYSWSAQRRGFIRNGLNAGRCDLVPGVAAGMEMLATTRPYYRSAYVFVTRAERKLDLHSLDDPRLRSLKIGVQMIGDDFSNTPPAHALSRRGIVANVRGYTVYGDYSQANPPRAIIDAVGRGEIDVAVAWGPMAAYFAREQPIAMVIAPVEPLEDGVFPMSFAVAMGVRRKDVEFAAEIDRALERNRARIDAVLEEYAVPRVPPSTQAAGVAHDEESALRPVKPTSSKSSLTVP